MFIRISDCEETACWLGQNDLLENALVWQFCYHMPKLNGLEVGIHAVNHKTAGVLILQELENIHILCSICKI